jgi:hypothetical protein
LMRPCSCADAVTANSRHHNGTNIAILMIGDAACSNGIIILAAGGKQTTGALLAGIEPY